MPQNFKLLASDEKNWYILKQQQQQPFSGHYFVSNHYVSCHSQFRMIEDFVG